MALLFLIGSTTLIQPDWVLQNLGQVLAYLEYTVPGIPAGIFAVDNYQSVPLLLARKP